MYNADHSAQNSVSGEEKCYFWFILIHVHSGNWWWGAGAKILLCVSTDKV